jgi:hypothetical protein
VSAHDPREDYDDEPWRGLGPDRLVRRTANLMWSVGMLQLSTSAFCAFSLFVHAIDVWKNSGTVTNSDMRGGIFLAAAAIVGSACSGVAIAGATAMHRRTRYPLAVAGAILTIFSIPCLIALPYGLAVGAWALIVLARGDVRAGFDTVRPSHGEGDS